MSCIFLHTATQSSFSLSKSKDYQSDSGEAVRFWI